MRANDASNIDGLMSSISIGALYRQEAQVRRRWRHRATRHTGAAALRIQAFRSTPLANLSCIEGLLSGGRATAQPAMADKDRAD